MSKSNQLDSLDDYLERRGGVDDAISNEAEELLATATTCPGCGGTLSKSMRCQGCGADWNHCGSIEDARRKLDDLGVSYE